MTPTKIDGASTSNAQVRARWRIDADVDPESVPLAELNPGNGDWFEQDKELRLFQRLRRAAPVRYTADSQFGA